jgi:hypothetical protein
MLLLSRIGEWAAHVVLALTRCCRYYIYHLLGVKDSQVEVSSLVVIPPPDYGRTVNEIRTYVQATDVQMPGDDVVYSSYYTYLG